MASPENFIEIINKFEIYPISVTNSHISYLFAEEGTKELLDFFCNYITLENSITNEELECYETLIRNNNVKHGSKIEENIIIQYPELIFQDEFANTTLKEELARAKEDLQEYELILEVNRKNNSDFDHTLEYLEDENLHLNLIYERLAESVKQLLHVKEKSEKHLKENLHRVVESYNQFSPIHLVHSMEMATKKLDQIFRSLRNYVKCLSEQQFKLFYPTEVVLGRLNKLKYALPEEMENYLIQKIQLESERTKYNYLKSGVENEISPSDIDTEIMKMQHEVAAIQQELLVMTDQLTSVISKWAENEIAKFLVDYNQKKLDRRLLRANTVATLLNNVSTTRNHHKFMNAYLHSYLDRLNGMKEYIVNSYKDVHVDQRNSEKRMNLMDEKINQYNSLKSSSVLEQSEFCQILMQMIATVDKNRRPQQVSDLYTNYEEAVNKFKKIIAETVNEDSQALEQNVRAVRLKLRPFMQTIFSGETMQPLVNEINVLQLLYELKEKIKKEHENIIGAEKKIINYQTKLSSDEWFRSKHFLWVWFLIQPKKVLKKISAIQKYVTANQD